MAASRWLASPGRYARALFELGVDKGLLRGVRRASWRPWPRPTPRSAELRQTLENPVFKLTERRAMLEKLLPRRGAQPRGAQLRSAAARPRPHRALPAIARAYREMVDAQLGRVRADGDLGPAAGRRRPPTAVQRALEQRTGKKVLITSDGRPRADRRHRRPGGRPGVRRQPAHASSTTLRARILN